LSYSLRLSSPIGTEAQAPSIVANKAINSLDFFGFTPLLIKNLKLAEAQRFAVGAGGHVAE